MDRHTHPCQDVLAGTGVHNPKAESCIKTLKVQAVWTTKPPRMSPPIFPAVARGTGYPSPLVTYACPAAGAEQMCSPVNIACTNELIPSPKSKFNTRMPCPRIIGLHQQIVPLKCAHRNEPALDQNILVGETGQRRCHENAIAYEGRGAETGTTLYPDEIAVG